MKNIIFLSLFIASNAVGQSSKYEEHVIAGLKFLQARNISAAIDEYRLALEFDSRGIDANYGIAVCYSAFCIQNGDYCIDALDHYKVVNEIASGYRNTHRNMSTCYIKTYQYKQAVDYCDKAIAQNPEDGESYFYRGYAKIELKKTEEGCTDLKRALSLGFEDAQEKLLDYCK